MEIELPPKLEFLIYPKRFKIAFGGRGGAKTVTFAKVLLAKGMQSKIRVLCLREFQSSIDDSVHSALKEEIVNMGMEHHYRVTNNMIEGINGTLFKYAALSRNPESIKSKHDFDIAWIEEAETVTQKSLDILFPTIRAAGSEIWMSFNPDDEFGAVYSLVKPHIDEIRSKGFYADEDYHIVKINLEDNPFAPEELKHASDLMKREDPKKWLNIYGGEVYSDYKQSIIQPEWFDAAIDSHIKLKFQPMGVKSLGFDPADTGSDAKAVMMRHGSVITHGKMWSDGQIPEAIDIAFECAYDWRAEHIVYDNDGLGRAIKVGLAPRIQGKNIEVTPYGGNDAVDDPGVIYKEDKINRDTFRNKRAQYYWALRDRFEDTYNAINKGIYTDPEKMISISSDLEDLDVLKSELIKIERKRGQNSFIQIESKIDMARRGVKSPNMADALVMCFANPAPIPETINLEFESDWN
jgi:phage terminase large subunit